MEYSLWLLTLILLLRSVSRPSHWSASNLTWAGAIPSSRLLFLHSHRSNPLLLFLHWPGFLWPLLLISLYHPGSNWWSDTGKVFRLDAADLLMNFNTAPKNVCKYVKYFVLVSGHIVPMLISTAQCWRFIKLWRSSALLDEWFIWLSWMWNVDTCRCFTFCNFCSHLFCPSIFVYLCLSVVTVYIFSFHTFSCRCVVLI